MSNRDLMYVGRSFWMNLELTWEESVELSSGKGWGSFITPRIAHSANVKTRVCITALRRLSSEKLAYENINSLSVT
jgi:hypothetical protein